MAAELEMWINGPHYFKEPYKLFSGSMVMNASISIISAVCAK